MYGIIFDIILDNNFNVLFTVLCCYPRKRSTRKFDKKTGKKLTSFGTCKDTVNFRHPINTCVTDVCLIYQDFFFIIANFFDTFHHLSTRVQNPTGK